MASLLQRMRSGAKGQAVSKVIGIVIQLATVPAFLTAWGADLFGEWLILTALPTYLSLSDLGITTAAVREMNMNASRGDHDTAVSVFQSAGLLILGISLALLAVLAVGYLLPLASMLNLAQLDDTGAFLVVLFMTLNILINFQTRLFYGGYEADGKYGEGYMWLSGCLLFENVCAWTAALSGAGPVGTAITFFAARSAAQVLFRITVLKKVSWLVMGVRHASWATVKQLFAPSMASLIFPIAQAINIQGMPMLIGITLGPAYVTVFATHRTMTRTLLQPLMMINQIVVPELGAAWGNGNIDLLRNLHRRACQASLWFMGAVGVNLLVIAPYLMPVWTNGRVQLDETLFMLLFAVALFNSFWYASFSVEWATNTHMSIAKRFLPINLAAFAVAYLFILAGLSVEGACVSLILVEVATMFVVVPTSLRMSQDELTPFLWSLAKPPVDTIMRFVQRA